MILPYIFERYKCMFFYVSTSNIEHIKLNLLLFTAYGLIRKILFYGKKYALFKKRQLYKHL